MAHSTGKTCEAVKKIITQNNDVIIESHLLGNIEYLDSLGDSLQLQLQKAGCDWPVFIEQENNMKIYFSCCCKEGSVVYLEVKTKLTGHIEYLKSLIIQESGKVHQQIA